MKRARRRRRFACALRARGDDGLAVPFAWQSVKRGLGPLDLSRLDDGSTIVVDRDGRLLRAFTTADGRWRLPVTHADVDPRFLAMLQAYEDRRFDSAPRRRCARARPRRLAVRAQRPHRLRRLDADHAGRAPARAARGAHARRQAASDGARDRAGAALHQVRDPRSLSRARALRRQSRGSARRALAYFGKEPKRLTTAEAALLVALPQSPKTRRPDRNPRGRARGARPRARSRGAPWRHHDDGSDRGEGGARSAARRAFPATRRARERSRADAPRRARASCASPSTQRLQAALEALAQEARRTARAARHRRDPRHRQPQRRNPRPCRFGRLLLVRARRRAST